MNKLRPWRAAADRIFGEVRAHLGARVRALEIDDPRELVRYAARHPELLHFLVEKRRSDDERMPWRANSHLKPLYQAFRGLIGAALPDLDESLVPRIFYVMSGAGSVMFARAPECRHLSGVDPRTDPAIERHTDFVARLLLVP